MTLPTTGPSMEERIAESRRRRYAEALEMGGEQAEPWSPFVALMRRYCIDYTARHDGARAAWGGVGVYRWDGQRLLENYVEQDYFARRRQLAGDGPDPVEPPAVAPWDTRSVPADPAAEAVVRGWLAGGDLTGVTVDDGHHPAHPLVAAARTEISVLFSAGSRVAFHAVRHGPLTGEDPRFAGDSEAMLHLAGVVRVAGGQVAGGRVITDRLGLLRRLGP